MDSLGYEIRQLLIMFITDPELRFKAQLVLGAMLMGSSIAYPILSQDGSSWAPVALSTFFFSGAVFNGLQISIILMYGHYILVVCAVSMILIMAFGHDTVADHVHFIPVYAMGSTFLTAACPSLEDSLTRIQTHGREYLPIQDASEPLGRLHAPLMAGVQVGPQDRATPPSPPSPISTWGMGQGRQWSSPPPVSPPTSLPGGVARPGEGPVAAWVNGLQHMGPGSDCSNGHTHTGTSISLSSRQTVPSELSTNVVGFFDQRIPARIPRKTQRRRDIDGLGQPVRPRQEEPSSSSQAVERSHTG
ncbi:hypothetical protein VM1G_01831 [Cytospora mali]|uniref:Uncharacterized protein n=1 Tax=Cytospora mali TaxID=578113 RepID=A0A194VRB5_CYTMA|nr:hypothetical protein VM1G_01831 [Valsa mali]